MDPSNRPAALAPLEVIGGCRALQKSRAAPFAKIKQTVLKHGFASVTSDINGHRGCLIVHLELAIRSGKDLRRETL